MQATEPTGQGGFAPPPPMSPAPAAETMDDRETVASTVRRLIASGKALVDAEVAYGKARAAFIGKAAQWIAIFGVLALILVFATVVTLMVGGVLVLAPHVGTGIALLIVVVCALVLLGGCAFGILAQVKRIKGMP